VTPSLAVFEAEIQVKSARLINSRLKTEKIWKYKTLYIELHLKDCFGMEFTTCSGEMMPKEALTSFTISDAYR